MGVETAAAVGLVGAGVQAYGQYQSARSSAEAAKQNAKLQKAQAQQMLEKMKIEESRMQSQGAEFAAKQINSYGAGGVQIGTGASLLAMEDTNMKINQGINDMRRDTLFRVNQINVSSKFGLQQANEAKTAGAISAGSSLLEGAGTYYNKTA